MTTFKGWQFSNFLLFFLSALCTLLLREYEELLVATWHIQHIQSNVHALNCLS